MNLVRLHHHPPSYFLNFRTPTPSPPRFLSLPRFRLTLALHPFPSPVLPKSKFPICRVSGTKPSSWTNEEKEEESEDLAPDSAIYQKTLRLVECSMFAAVAGLAYFLSNSLAIENYFGCFFSLPIVISSMRWGVAAGRKTMVATAMLLFVLSGPVKASTYLLLHGLVGLSMGSLWWLGANWALSIFLCTLVVFAYLPLELPLPKEMISLCSKKRHLLIMQVRSVGALGYVSISSFLIRENILALITLNVHASVTYMFTALGVNTIPSMDLMYAIFGTVLLLNSGFFVFLLHILYAVFLSRLGMKASLTMPKWLEKAI